MRKFLLTLGIAASAFSMHAANAYNCVPAPGAINIGDYPGGIGSIEIECGGKGVINRNCTGYAVLSLGSTILKSIPASNERMVRCYDGFSVVNEGTPHISFFDTQSSPASLPGDYTVTIPSNFFTVDGVPNTPLVYNFSIAGIRTSIDYVPAKGSSIEELNQVKVIFNDAAAVEYRAKTNQDTETGIYYEVTIPAEDPEADDEIKTVDCTKVEVEGNTVTVTFDPYSEKRGVIDINFLAGIFRITGKDGKTGTSASATLRYNWNSSTASMDGYSVAPAPGEISDVLMPLQVIKEHHEAYGSEWYTTQNIFFSVAIPEGYSAGYVLKPKITLNKVNADGTEEVAKKNFMVATNEDKSKFNIYYDEDTPEIKLGPGKYYLVIPAQTFQLKDESGSTTMNPEEMKFGPWTVETEPLKYTISPSENETVSELSVIEITFEEGVKVVVPKTAWFTVMDGAIQYDLKGTATDNVVKIVIEPALSVNGEYTLTAPASAVVANGYDTEINAKFTVKRDIIRDINLINNNKAVSAILIDDQSEYDLEYWQVFVETDPATNDSTPMAEILFELPYGYDAVYAMDQSQGLGEDPLMVKHRIPASDLEAEGFVKLADNTLSGLTVGTHIYGFAYANGTEATQPTMLMVNVIKSTVGVDGVEAEEAPEYYNLQGIKVENPEKGIYIKVVNGISTKVNLK